MPTRMALQQSKSNVIRTINSRGSELGSPAHFAHEDDAMMEEMAAAEGEDSSFTPFTVDVSPLQKLLINLTQQVEKLQAENYALRDDVAKLKIDKRLEALESGLQELAENQKSAAGATAAMGAFAPFPQLGPDGSPASGSAADSSWVTAELTAIKDRLSGLERKSEALWHVQEGGEEVRVLVGRLKTDVEAVQASLTDTQGSMRHTSHLVERLDSVAVQARETVSQLNEKVSRLEAEEKKSTGERRETGVKVEAQVNSLWDQIRHVENSLSQRLTLAETSQVSTLQEVDEQKEQANELVVRLEEAKRHTVALESKLDSFNTQVAAAIAPLHNSLANVQVRVEELAGTKQDADKAITLTDVNTAAARAVEHADRRADNIIKSMGAMEERIEALDEAKAALADVVLAVDLEALLAAHAQQLDSQLAHQKDDIMKAMSLKADREEVVALEARQGARLGVLEAAILKGLKAISEKVAAALAEKLDLTRFSEFKVQVRAILADVEDRLRDWSPAARGMKAPLDASGAQGASSCLCCDSRVRSVRDLQAMGFSAADKVLSPERLPVTEPLLPAITRSPDVAAYNNAKVAARKKDVVSLLRSSPAAASHLDNTGSATGMLAAYSAAASAAAPNGSLLSVLDPAALLGTKGEAHKAKPGSLTASLGKVDVETISGAISQGRIPDTRNPGRVPGKLARQASEGLNAWQGSGSLGASLPSPMSPTASLLVDTTKPLMPTAADSASRQSAADSPLSPSTAAPPPLPLTASVGGA